MRHFFPLAKAGLVRSLVYGFSQIRKMTSKEQTASTNHNPGFVDHDQRLASAGNEDALVTLHRRTGEVEVCHVGAESVWQGLADEDLLGTDFMQRVHIADRPTCLAAFDRVLHTQHNERFELRLRCSSKEKAGEHFVWIEMDCRLLDAPSSFRAGQENDELLSERQAPVLLCVSRDISHWKEREQALLAERQAAQDLATNRLRFLEKMSHELRTPLNAIIGFSEMMKSPGLLAQNEQQIMDYAAIIHKSGGHLLEVADEIFNMSQFEAGTYETQTEIFSLGDLVETSLAFVQTEMQKKAVRLSAGRFDSDVQIFADKRLCRLALVEFMAGPVRAAKHGERLELEIATKGADRGICEFVIHTETNGLSSEVGLSSSCFAAPSVQLQNCLELLQAELTSARSKQGRQENMMRLPVNRLAAPSFGQKSDEKHEDKVVALKRAAVSYVDPLQKSA